MGKAGKIFEYNGSIYDSQEEIWFAQWLDELKDNGFITSWSRDTETIVVAPPLVSTYKQGKTLKKQTVLRKFHYTPDFIINWDEKAAGLFYNTLNTSKITQPFISQNNVSIVETKPEFDRNNMTRLFREIQKLLWITQSKFINLVILPELFSLTFTPRAFLKTKTGLKRKITKWNPLTLQEYLQQNTNDRRKN